MYEAAAAPGVQPEALINRLRELERERDEARMHAARLAAQVQEAQALLDEARGQAAEAKEALARQQETYALLAGEVAGMRQFALQAVDGVRGETRAVRERCAYLEGLVKDKEMLLETFRQLAYRQGAAIPPALQPRKPA